MAATMTGLQTAERKPGRLAAFPDMFRRHRNIVIGGVMLLLVILVAVLAPVLMTHDPTFQDPGERLLAPSAEYLFGTDGQGRDVYSRVVKGAQLSLIVGLSVSFATVVLGGFIGLVTGFVPRLDAPVMRVMDGLMAFPESSWRSASWLCAVPKYRTSSSHLRWSIRRAWPE